MKHAQSNAIVIFLLLTDLPWSQPDRITKYIRDDAFILEVTNKNPNKAFSLTLPFNSKTDVQLKCGNDEEVLTYPARNLDSAFEVLLFRKIITQSRYGKLIKGLDESGRPHDIIEELTPHEKLSDELKAFYGGLYSVDELAKLQTVSFTLSRQTGEDRIDIIRIYDEHDNELSGRYSIYSSADDDFFDVDVNPEDLSVHDIPVDKGAYLNVYLQKHPEVKVNSVPTFTVPTFQPQEAETILTSIHEEFNSQLGLPTVVIKLNFDIPTYALSIAKERNGWYVYIVALKGDMVYISYAGHSLDLNYIDLSNSEALHLREVLAISNDVLSLMPIKNVVVNHFNQSQISQSSGFNYSSQPAGGPNFDRLVGKSAEMEAYPSKPIWFADFNRVVSNIFRVIDSEPRTKDSLRNRTVKVFTQVLSTFGHRPLNVTEVSLLNDIYDQKSGGSDSMTLANVYENLHRLRPEFVVTSKIL